MDAHRLVKPAPTPNKVVKDTKNADKATNKVEYKGRRVTDGEMKITNKVQPKPLQKSSMVQMNKPSVTKNKHRLVKPERC